jgi:homopolymeric O-antigen transport system permease protein
VAATQQDPLVLIKDAPQARRREAARHAGYARAGLAELIEAGRHWRLWHLIGIGELRRRYARSRMGQLWLTLSSGISIGMIGVTWAVLWKIPVAEMLPFLAVSMVIWQLVSGILTEATTVLPASAYYLLSQRMACATVIFALVYRNVLVLIHNTLIIAIVFIAFSSPLSFKALLVLPALLLTVTTALWFGYMLAVLCARFRDLVHGVQSGLQIAFYLSPIIWKPEFLPEGARWLHLVNPFAIFIGIIRDPLMDAPLSPLPWLIATGIAFGGLALSLSFIGRYRRRVLYWL